MRGPVIEKMGQEQLRADAFLSLVIGKCKFVGNHKLTCHNVRDLNRLNGENCPGDWSTRKKTMLNVVVMLCLRWIIMGQS